MKKETKQLVNFYKEFGADAQKVLDFVSSETNQRKMRNTFAQEETESNSLAENNEVIPDGVYFITEDGDRIPYIYKDQTAPTNTIRIGVKMGNRAIAVALHDLPGDKNGELQLLPSNHASPATSEHYTYDKKTDRYQVIAYEDFNGKRNTERLKEYGCTIELADDEWIPSIGVLGLLMMNATEVNEAIEKAGGKPIKNWHWSSTEYSQFFAWNVNFSDGTTNQRIKSYVNAVRAVAAF